METENDIQDDLRATFTELSKTGGSSEPNQQAAPAIPEPTAAPQPTPAPTSAPAADDGTGRDASGRYAPRQPAEPVSPNQQPQPTQQPMSQQSAPERAPVSWKPLVREKWATLDPEVKAEVLRRERDVDTALRDTAEARRLAGELNNVVQPYLGMLNAENTTPIKAIDALLRTAAALRTSPPMQKAELVANMIQQYGIDLGMLDQHLVSRMRGQPAPNDPLGPFMQQLDQRLQPMQQFMQQFQQRQQETMAQQRQKTQETLEQFMNDPANEFARDVALDMADILDLAASRGQQMSLQDAYARATMLHPQISEIVAQRKLASSASQQSEAARRAQAASASVGNSGAPSQGSEGGEGDDVRSAIVAAMKSSGR